MTRLRDHLCGEVFSSGRYFLSSFSHHTHTTRTLIYTPDNYLDNVASKGRRKLEISQGKATTMESVGGAVDPDAVPHLDCIGRFGDITLEMAQHICV